MKTLHLYLTRQVLATLVMTVAVFTFVLLLGNVLKEILVLLVNRQATLGMVLHAFALLIPWVFAFALPMGMLTAALLVFGRFSADQELTAVRSSGVSLVALISPILLLSLALCALSALINMEIAPRCRVAYTNLRDSLLARMTGIILPEGGYYNAPATTNGGPYLIYVRKSDGRNLRDIRAYEFDDAQKLKSKTFAQRGTLETTNQETTLLLEDIRVERMVNGDLRYASGASVPLILATKGAPAAAREASLSDMTFRQLQNKLRELDNLFSASEPSGQDSDALRKRLAHFAADRRDLTMPVRVQMHRQVAVSFACFGFTLVGIPLGIRAHRRETNVGIVMALALVLVYYTFIIVGSSLNTRAELAPYLILWLPNFIFQAVGGVMLWRANHGT